MIIRRQPDHGKLASGWRQRLASVGVRLASLTCGLSSGWRPVGENAHRGWCGWRCLRSNNAPTNGDREDQQQRLCEAGR